MVISVYAGCINRFVRVKYDEMSSTITCTFLNELDTSIKSCVVMYGHCGQKLNQTTRGNSTVEDPNIISLPVNSNRIACFVVTANSGSLTVLVDSQAEIGRKGNQIDAYK